MIEINCIQGSLESGTKHASDVVTASEVSRIITPKGALVQEARRAARYRDKLLAEWALGEPVEEFQGTYWTERGLGLEGEALAAFSLLTDVDARPLGFARHASLLAGCSPDWWIDESDRQHPRLRQPRRCGGEVPRPLIPTSATCSATAVCPAKYWPQVQFSMWVCAESTHGRFMSYHPELPPFI